MITQTRLVPIDGPSAWRGDELADRTDWIYHLNDAELTEIRTVAERFVADDPDLREVTAEDYPLEVLAPALRDFAADLDTGRGFILVRGIPVHEYSDALALAAFYIMGLHLGVPMRQNELGDVIDHILATSNKSIEDPSALSKAVRSELRFHSDSSDIVGLMCLRSAKSGGASRIVSGTTLYNEVLRRRPDLAPLLFEPWHYDWRRQDHDAPANTYTSPMCSYVDGVFSMYAGSRIIKSAQEYPEVPRLSQDQLDLLDLVDELAEESGMALDMNFQPGDIQWLLNYAALHSRREFQDYPEPHRRRHLLRLWLKRDVGRPLAPNFGRHVVKSRDETRDEETPDNRGRFRVADAIVPRAY